MVLYQIVLLLCFTVPVAFYLLVKLGTWAYLETKRKHARWVRQHPDAESDQSVNGQ